jgi:hypothetical protein
MILYPEYTGEADTWKPVELPALEESFINELSSVGAIAGNPRFRIVDGTKALIFHEGGDDLPRGNYLAYAAMVNVQTQRGFMYADGEGWKKVGSEREVPSGKLAIPAYDYADFGIPRYMVEVYRDAREPGVEESGYVWAWTVDVKERTRIARHDVEISRYRHPGSFDIEHARALLRILEMATKETIKAKAEKFMAARAEHQAEQKNTRRERQAEATEKFIRDNL